MELLLQIPPKVLSPIERMRRGATASECGVHCGVHCGGGVAGFRHCESRYLQGSRSRPPAPAENAYLDIQFLPIHILLLARPIHMHILLLARPIHMHMHIYTSVPATLNNGLIAIATCLPPPPPMDTPTGTPPAAPMAAGGTHSAPSTNSPHKNSTF